MATSNPEAKPHSMPGDKCQDPATVSSQNAMPQEPAEAVASDLEGYSLSSDDHDEEEEEQQVPFEPFEKVPLEP